MSLYLMMKKPKDVLLVSLAPWQRGPSPSHSQHLFQPHAREIQLLKLSFALQYTLYQINTALQIKSNQSIRVLFWRQGHKCQQTLIFVEQADLRKVSVEWVSMLCQGHRMAFRWQAPMYSPAHNFFLYHYLLLANKYQMLQNKNIKYFLFFWSCIMICHIYDIG